MEHAENTRWVESRELRENSFLESFQTARFAQPSQIRLCAI